MTQEFLVPKKYSKSIQRLKLISEEDFDNASDDVDLITPITFQNATPEERAKICNGCGAGNAKHDFVPDNLIGLYIGDVCDRHDWMYEFGTGIKDKRLADKIMLKNLRITIKNNKSILPFPL